MIAEGKRSSMWTGVPLTGATFWLYAMSGHDTHSFKGGAPRADRQYIDLLSLSRAGLWL